MTGAIKLSEAPKLRDQYRQDNKIGRILTNIIKFAVDSTADNSIKGVTGPKKFYKFVQERLRSQPSSLPFNNCKKPGDVKLVEEIEIKVQEMLEDRAKFKQQNETSAKCLEGTEHAKKGPNESSRKLDVLEPEKKRIFIRSRL